MDAQDKITLIIDWHLENKHKPFDPTFVYDLQEKIDEFGSISKQQERSLDNIIIKWGMM
jgi:hypothetical protein